MKAILTVGLCLTLAACGGSSSSAVQNDICSDLSSEIFSCEILLSDLKTVATDSVSTLQTQAALLPITIDDYCQAIDASEEADKLAAAKLQWQTTMQAMQVLELMQFGPIAEKRDELYVWPNNSLCRIDDQIATNFNVAMDQVALGYRSLTAVEYILFSEDVVSQCQTALSVPAWLSGTTLSERKTQRCTYAKNAALQVSTEATTLVSSLQSYVFNDEFTSLQKAANSISDALFYLDLKTKDSKIKGSLPQSSTAEFDDTKLESQFAHFSKENILANLQAARLMFTANNQVGFDDYLAALGQEQVALDMLMALDGAISNVMAIEGTLFNAVAAGASAQTCLNLASSGSYDGTSSNIDIFCALQGNIKTFTDLLKADFVLNLSFNTPGSASGDAD